MQTRFENADVVFEAELPPISTGSCRRSREDLQISRKRPFYDNGTGGYVLLIILSPSLASIDDNDPLHRVVRLAHVARVKVNYSVRRN